MRVPSLRLLLLSALCLLVSTRVQAQVPAFDRVFIIALENGEYEDIIGNPSAPYINSLARQYGLATNEYAPLHPSLPNYMALTGGDTFFTDNCVNCQTSAANIADQIEASGRTWKAYLEDMPAPCTATDSGLYAAKHNPFVHYSNIVFNTARCTSHDVPFTRFSTDLASSALPNYVWLTPNLCNDTHDCSLATGDNWLASIVPQILQSAAFTNSVLFLTWDEGTTDVGGGGHIPLIVVSSRTPAGLRVSRAINHYDVLRTIQDAWGLGPLAHSANGTALTEFFPSPPQTPTEQIIHAADVTTMTGAWRKVADSTAADGVKLAVPDAGAPIVFAQTNPASYFEADFTAQPGVRYRVWLRIRAAGDLATNDSVLVQFSDTVDSSGSPLNRIGTTSANIVNLWACETCRSFGWGWQRTSWWVGDTGDVWFPTGGSHRIRVQVREDGVEVDQIVISPSQYVDAAPGAVSADNTIVSKSGAPPPPPPPPSSTLPSPWQGQDVGSTGLAGSASYANDTFTIKGAGADIWGSADGFYYVSQPLNGDGQIVARVATVQNTGSFAKAAVMLRASTSAGAAHVILDVSPNGIIEFMTRATSGGDTSFLAGRSQGVPTWLRLVRSGNSITGSVSADGSAWTTVGTTSVSFDAAALVGLAVSSVNTSTLNTSTFDHVTVTPGSSGGGGSGEGGGGGVGNIPSPWVAQDVGSVGLAGSASYSSGTFTVKGAGADIWDTADAFQFVSQPLSGDGQIVARVASTQNTGVFAKAGVMLRATTAAGSAHVILNVCPNGSIEFMTRPSAGGYTTYLSGRSLAAPVWLRLARAGSTVTAATSADGTAWTTLGSTTTSLPSSLLVGLVVSSHDVSVANTSTFDNVAVTSGGSGGGATLPPGWSDQDIGSVGLAGSASASSGVFTVNAAGDDIWGTSDSFHFVSLPLSGDGEMVARVTGVQNTGAYAKAGLMIRQSTGSGSPHVIFDVSPDGIVEFMTRSTTGGETDWLAGGTRAFPVWLRLSRVGSTVTGYASSDGTSWTFVGSTTTSLTTGVLLGFAVSSHNPSVLNRSTFDNVSVAGGGP